MDKSEIQEDLLSLYLRLNGFFVSSLIVHSHLHGHNRTEIDALAVRFPHNSEPEREVGPDEYLETSDKHIDLLICEVKSGGSPLRFNPALANSEETIASVLRWAGMFSNRQLAVVAKHLMHSLQPVDRPPEGMPTVLGPGHTRVRALLCAPERWTRKRNQRWFLPGKQIFEYIWKCLCPESARASCSVSYDFGLWGKNYEPIVRYFKQHCTDGPRSMRELYQFFGVANQ